MRKGTVKQFDPNSAYGFIEDDLTHSSYFVFYKSIKEEGYKKLNVGQRVRYQLAQGKRVYNVSTFMLIMTKRRN